MSLATPPPAPERVADLTYQTVAPTAAVVTPPRERRLLIGFSVLLAVVIGVLWIIFR